MSLTQAEQALMTAASNALSTVSKTIDNAPFTPPANTKWARISIQSNQPTAHTTGPGGQDEITGILFVELNYPAGSGGSAPISDYDTLLAAFPGGKVLSSSGQQVHVISTGKSTKEKDNEPYRMTVKVGWYAFVTRST